MAVKLITPDKFVEHHPDIDWVLEMINDRLMGGLLSFSLHPPMAHHFAKDMIPSVRAHLENAGWVVQEIQVTFPDRPCEVGYMTVKLSKP